MQRKLKESSKVAIIIAVITATTGILTAMIAIFPNINNSEAQNQIGGNQIASDLATIRQEIVKISNNDLNEPKKILKYNRFYYNRRDEQVLIAATVVALRNLCERKYKIGIDTTKECAHCFKDFSNNNKILYSCFKREISPFLYIESYTKISNFLVILDSIILIQTNRTTTEGDNPIYIVRNFELIDGHYYAFYRLMQNMFKSNIVMVDYSFYSDSSIEVHLNEFVNNDTAIIRGIATGKYTDSITF